MVLTKGGHCLDRAWGFHLVNKLDATLLGVHFEDEKSSLGRHCFFVDVGCTDQNENAGLIPLG